MKRTLLGFALSLVLLAGFAGCGSDDAAGSGGGGSSSGGTGGTAVGGSAGAGGSATGGVAGTAWTDAGADASFSDDYQTFQDIRSGKLGAQEGLVTIAKSDGLPILSPNGFVFVRIDDGKGPYRLAGDHEGWVGTDMTHEAGVYWLEVSLPSPDGSKYKYVDSANEFTADALSRRYGYDNFGEFSLVRSTANHLERWPEIGGTGIPPRTLRARVPASAPTHHLYVHDGQNLFDPAAAYGGWKLDESLGTSTLAIGIDNAGTLRMEEYTHVADDPGGGLIGGKGDAYSDYVKDVVRPFVEQKFGVPARVGVMGSSLGGLIAFHEALRDPSSWDFAASLSGTMGWGSIGKGVHNETMIERFAKAQKIATKLYLDSGGGPASGCVDSDGDGIDDDEPNAGDNYCENLQLRDVLTGKGYQLDQDVSYWWENGAGHNEAAWAARVFRPVQIFEAL